MKYVGGRHAHKTTNHDSSTVLPSCHSLLVLYQLESRVARGTGAQREARQHRANDHKKYLNVILHKTVARKYCNASRTTSTRSKGCAESKERPGTVVLAHSQSYGFHPATLWCNIHTYIRMYAWYQYVITYSSNNNLLTFGKRLNTCIILYT